MCARVEREEGDARGAHEGRGRLEVERVGDLYEGLVMRGDALGVGAVDCVAEALESPLAEDLFTSRASRTLAAAGPVQVRDPIANVNPRARRVFPDKLDLTGELVSEDRRHLHHRKAAATIDEVPAAHRRG